MQVSVETTAGLERRMTVEVPEERIEQEVQTRLKSMAGRVKMDGFRPGKIPFKVVEQRFAGQIRKEVMGDIVQKSFSEAVQQEKLRPAGGTKIDKLTEQPGKGLEYTAVFDVYPEIALAPLEDLKVEKPVAEVTGQDVDKMIETLRRQRQTWVPVEREARNGDQLQFSVKTSIDGGEWAGSDDKQTLLVLGANNVPQEIETQLLGVKAGGEATVSHKFPEDHLEQAMANKPVQYIFKIISVSEPKLPEVDEKFIQGLGVEIGTLEALKSEIRENMQRELQQALQNNLKQQVMDALLEANSIDVPKMLVNNEAERMVQEAKSRMRAQGLNAKDVPLQPSLFEEPARRRVILGLLLADIIKAREIKVNPQKLRSKLEAIASTYEDPEEVIKWYYGSQERLAQIETLTLEDQVVEAILEHANISESATTFGAMMNPQSSEKTGELRQ